jgi:pimeloyl-ACP methyl ester carboxylesterase
MASSKTIVLVHGLFVNNRSWAPWVNYLEGKGYKVVTIPYPGRDKEVATLKAEHPDAKLGDLSLEQVLQHHINIIKGLDEKPIIIGHSFGGLLTQLLINRGYGAAGIAIGSVPPQGILSFEWSFLKSTFPLLNPFNSSSKPYLMPFSHFQYTFVNGMPLAEQQKAYNDAVVPESIRLGRDGLGSGAKVDFSKAHAPLLFIGGETDHIMPASLNKTNAEKYQKGSSSVTEYKLFPNRNHYGIAADGWEEMADYVYTWIQKQGV